METTKPMKLKQKILAAIVGFIVIFSIVGALLPTAQTEGNNLNATNVCINAGCAYNDSRTVACTVDNTTAADTTQCTKPHSIPLGGLFAGGGIVFIIFMVFLFKDVIGVKKN